LEQQKLENENIIDHMQWRGTAIGKHNIIAQN
jgi:hypothetical protein